MGWSDEGRICQTEGRNGGERGVVIDGEIQTHDTCKRGQSRPYRVTEILLKTEIPAFSILKTCCQCRINFNQNGLKNKKKKKKLI